MTTFINSEAYKQAVELAIETQKPSTAIFGGVMYSVNPSGEATQTGLIEVDDSRPSGILDIADLVSQQVAHNFDGTEVDKWRLEAIATGPDAITDDSRFGEPIAIRYWYLHVVELEGDTPGEVVPAIRTVLITPDNKAYGFVSAGVAADVARLARAFGKGPLDPPVAMIAQRIKTGGKGSIIRLTPAPE